MSTVWDANPRWIRIRVFMGPDLVEVTPAIVGDVTIGRDGASPLPTCDFTLYAPEMAYFAVGSLSAGPQPVLVTVTCWATGYAAETRTEFEGYAEAPSNSGIYVPSGQVHAISSLSRVANTPGCLLAGGFQGRTRVEDLELFAEAALCPLTIDGTLATSAEITKPVDLQGITVLDLAAKWGPLDAWEARENAGALQLVPHDAICGPAATPVHAFSRESYFSTAETAPSRPTTKRLLEGWRTHLEPDGTVTTVNGDTTRIVTTVGGAITSEITEARGNYTPLGTTPQTPLVDTVLTRETVTNTYTMSGGLPTAQLLAKTTVLEAWYSPKSSAGTGGGNHTFVDGSFHRQAVETLQEVRREVKTFTWDVISCHMATSTTVTTSWDSPIVETTDDATYTDPGTVWPDGITRLGAYETYGAVPETVETVDKWAPAAGYIDVWDGYWAQPHNRGAMRYSLHHRYRTVAGNNRTQEYVSTLWLENLDGTKHQVLTRTPKIIKWYTGIYLSTTWEQTAPRIDDVNEPLPRPPIASGVERQFSLVPFVAIREAIGTGFEDKTQAGTDESPESVGEATRLLRWQERLELADRLTVSHPYRATSVLREWDACTADDPARAIVEMPGWVEDLKMALGPANGKAEQVSTVAIDRYPADDPMSEAI